MKYCLICFEPFNGVECHSQGCKALKELYKEKGIVKDFEAEVTFENRFCAKCNIILEKKQLNCPLCGNPSFPITESHLKEPAPVLLSGIGAKAIWE